MLSMTLLFFEGVLVGLAISAPVGPINILCIRRSLAFGPKLGFLTGFGAAVGDTLYGAIAAFGLTWISDLFIANQPYLQIVGGISFGVMGLRISRAKPIQAVADTRVLSGWSAFVSTVFLTLANPATIVAFLAAFTAFNLGALTKDAAGATAMTTGVFAGSSLWWAFLTAVSLRFRMILTPQALQRINFWTGVMLLAFAAFLLGKGVHGIALLLNA